MVCVVCGKESTERDGDCICFDPYCQHKYAEEHPIALQIADMIRDSSEDRFKVPKFTDLYYYNRETNSRHRWRMRLINFIISQYEELNR